MRIRSFIIAYALVLAILLFADRRPGSTQQDRYSHVVDLTDEQNAAASRAASAASIQESRTRIIAPAAIIPGTWTAGQIPAERLIAPLVVLDLNIDLNSDSKNHESISQISLDDIAAWESRHGMIPPGSVLAIRRAATTDTLSTASPAQFPISREAAEFLIDARNTIGFAVETPVDLTSGRGFDHDLAQQLALHGSYVIERAARFTSLPATGSLIIVAPAKDKKPGEVPVRILAMVR
jgi:kynurenine formamidase